MFGGKLGILAEGSFYPSNTLGRDLALHKGFELFLSRGLRATLNVNA